MFVDHSRQAHFSIISDSPPKVESKRNRPSFLEAEFPQKGKEERGKSLFRRLSCATAAMFFKKNYARGTKVSLRGALTLEIDISIRLCISVRP